MASLNSLCHHQTKFDCSTAIACVVRTVFSGELRSPDISCEYYHLINNSFLSRTPKPANHVASRGWSSQCYSENVSLGLGPLSIGSNTFASIEVNLGNIAACMPLMKPLVRYMRAQISGKDIPETLRPTRSPTIPRSRWDIRFWTPRTHRGTAGAEDQRVWPSRAKSRPLIDDHQPLKQPYRTGARLAPVKDGAPNSESLELPMQGQSEEDCTDVIDFKSYPTKRDQKIYGDVTERWDQPENV